MNCAVVLGGQTKGKCFILDTRGESKNKKLLHMNTLHRKRNIKYRKIKYSPKYKL